jgi:hypothetical protein
MDARRGKDASVLEVGEATGGILASTFAAWRENWHAAFAADAVNRQKVPRVAHSR